MQKIRRSVIRKSLFYIKCFHVKSWKKIKGHIEAAPVRESCWKERKVRKEGRKMSEWKKFIKKKLVKLVWGFAVQRSPAGSFLLHILIFYHTTRHQPLILIIYFSSFEQVRSS